MTRSSIKIIVFTICLLTAYSVKAQREIVQRAIAKVATAKNMSYNLLEDGTSFFGDDIHFKNRVYTYGQADNSFKAYSIENQREHEKLVYLFDGEKKVDLNFRDSTYTLSDPPKGTSVSTLHQLSSQLKEVLAKRNYVVAPLADSTVNKTPCYHILVHSESPEKKTYDRFHVFIDKKTDLILALTTELKGEFSKGGMALGTLSEKMKYVFSDIRISSDEKKNPVTINIPAGFKIEKKSPMLSKGAVAPQWTLTSTDGRKLSLADLKNKVVLMEFTFNGCPACMLALPVLEKMHQKYDGTDVAIVSVNYVDTKEAVAQFIKTNKVKSPIYINGRPLSKVYQVSAGPSFYLINKKGEIDWTSEGFFEDFESKVSANIEALR
ncbi:MAG: TlpA disulfide reductase family protein [Bacteroidota bacterium]